MKFLKIWILILSVCFIIQTGNCYEEYDENRETEEEEVEDEQEIKEGQSEEEDEGTDEFLYSGEDEAPRVKIKVFRGPTEEKDGESFATWGYWIKQPSNN